MPPALGTLWFCSVNTVIIFLARIKLLDDADLAKISLLEPHVKRGFWFFSPDFIVVPR